MIIIKEGKELSLADFAREIPFVSHLDFEDPSILQRLQKECAKLKKKGELSREQLWLGCYYKKEISDSFLPDVEIRWIDDRLGWGVFAARNFKKMEFIAEYGGKVRKRRRSDAKNSYCFEYILASGIRTPYNIDAQDQGGVARYINHSGKPNLHSALATFDDLSHVILYVKEPISKGAQLTYDYGPDYWAHRPPAQKL